MRETREASEEEIDVACRDLVEMVTAYLEGVLDPAMARAVEAHLLLCAECEDYIVQMRTTIQLVGRVPLDTLSTQAKAGLMAAFRNFSARPVP